MSKTSKKIISVDYETHLISEDSPSPKPVCLSAYDGDKEYLINGHADTKKFLIKIFQEYDLIVAHNMKFELLVTWNHFPELKPQIREGLKKGQFYCTMITEKIYNNMRAKQKHRLDLATLVFDYFQEDISEDKKNPDTWRLRYHELDGVPLSKWPKEAKRYAIEDSIWAFKVHEMQRAGLKAFDLKGFKPKAIEDNILFGIKSEFWLNTMAQTGIRVDRSRVQELEDEIHAYIDPRIETLEEQGFISRDKTGKTKKNMKMLKEYITEIVPESDIVKTTKGGISTTGEALAKYLPYDEGGTIQNFMEIAEYEKVLTAFVSNLKLGDTIRTEYNAVVSTGRTSSRKSRFYPSVNIQQMPREVKNVKWDVRNCFVPREGFKMVSIDYAGLELASVAHRLYKHYGKSEMRRAINKGNFPTDMHSMFAYKVRNMKEKEKIDYETFVANKKKKGYAEYRQLAKPINLGFPGGIGYDTMRGLLYKSGIETKFQILMERPKEEHLKYWYKKYKKKYPNLRIARLEKWKYALVFDELVGLKRELFDLYPELKKFLTMSHEKALTGETIKMKNEYGEWEDEPMYSIKDPGLERDYCTYTAYCNGYLMQSPSAKGAKLAMNAIIEKYIDDNDMNPLAFIHDEIVFEVREGPKALTIINDVANILIREMQKELYSVRITVEADMMDYWSKSGGSWTRMYWKDYNKDEVEWV